MGNVFDDILARSRTDILRRETGGKKIYWKDTRWETLYADKYRGVQFYIGSFGACPEVYVINTPEFERNTRCIYATEEWLTKKLRPGGHRIKWRICGIGDGTHANPDTRYVITWKYNLNTDWNGQQLDEINAEEGRHKFTIDEVYAQVKRVIDRYLGLGIHGKDMTRDEIQKILDTKIQNQAKTGQWAIYTTTSSTEASEEA